MSTENYKEVRKKSIAYIDIKLNEYLIDNNIYSTDKDDVITMSLSILETKFPEIGPGYGGGSFVQAFVDNDLSKVMATADSVNRNFLHFYSVLVYNFSTRYVL